MERPSKAEVVHETIPLGIMQQGIRLVRDTCGDVARARYHQSNRERPRVDAGSDRTVAATRNNGTAIAVLVISPVCNIVTP